MQLVTMMSGPLFYAPAITAVAPMCVDLLTVFAAPKHTDMCTQAPTLWNTCQLTKLTTAEHCDARTHLTNVLAEAGMRR